MGKMKEIFMEIQESLGEDIEITEQMFNQHLIEKGLVTEQEIKESDPS